LTSPTTALAGTRTSSKNTSLKPAWPVICISGRTVIPADFISTRKYVMPRCFGASGSVRARRMM
jgi:hypothetical protein